MDWLSLGTSIIGGLSGASRAKISKAGASGQSMSGLNDFASEDNISFKSPLLDFTNPAHLALSTLAVVAGVYAYKKMR